jgi:hypothetical protein
MGAGEKKGEDPEAASEQPCRTQDRSSAFNGARLFAPPETEQSNCGGRLQPADYRLPIALTNPVLKTEAAKSFA